MHQHRIVLAAVALPLLFLGACDGASDPLLNNGERGEISMGIAGVPANHQPFPVLIFVQKLATLCGEGQTCIEEVPIIGMSAGCEDESICTVQQQEPVEEGRRCRVTVDAQQSGETRLLVEVETANGELRRDAFPIRVAAPTNVEVGCPGCEAGLEPGEETQASCRMFNPDVSPGPLLGTCDAWALGEGIEVLGAGDGTGMPVPHFEGTAARRSGSRAFGNTFTLRKTLPQSAEVLFSGGDVEQRVLAR